MSCFLKYATLPALVALGVRLPLLFIASLTGCESAVSSPANSLPPVPTQGEKRQRVDEPARAKPAPAGAVLVAEAEKKQGERKQRPAYEKVIATALSPDGKRVAVAITYEGGSRKRPRRPRAMELWDLEASRRLWVTYKRKDEGIGSGGPLAFFPDGKRLLACRGDALRVVDAGTGAETGTLVKDAKGATCFLFSPDGKSLLVGYHDGRLQLRDATTGRVRRHLRKCRAGIRSLALSPNGRIAFVTPYFTEVPVTVYLWDVETNKPWHLFPRKDGWEGPVAFAPDGRTALLQRYPEPRKFEDRGQVVLWDLVANKAVRTWPRLEPPSMVLTAMAVTADGKHVLCASGEPSTLSLRELGSGKALWSVKAFANILSADGRLALMAGGPGDPDDSVLFWLWDATKGGKLRQIGNVEE